LPLSSPEEKLWFSALARAKRLRPLLGLSKSRRRRKGPSPKSSEELGLDHGLFIRESAGWLSSKIPCAKIKSDNLSSYIP